MTHPPQRLLDILPVFSGTIDLLHVNGEFEAKISYTDAIAHIMRGEVEGVGPKSGTVKFLRYLPPEQQPEVAPEFIRAQTWSEPAGHSVLAQAGIGAYRQHLCDGHTAYALCLLRTKGI